MASSKLGRQIKQLLGSLNAAGVQFALIGGLYLASHKVICATQDIDILVLSDDVDLVDRLLTSLGYQSIHRSADADNYQREDERVDVLYASRPISRRLLQDSVEKITSFGRLRVVTPEGLRSYLMSSSQTNINPTAFPDTYPLSGPNHKVISVEPDSDPYVLLDELMEVVEALCPEWPARGTFSDSDKFLL